MSRFRVGDVIERVFLKVVKTYKVVRVCKLYYVLEDEWGVVRIYKQYINFHYELKTTIQIVNV